MAKEEPLPVGPALYSQSEQQSVCVLIDERGDWQIATDPDTGATTITIPPNARWRVTTDTFRPTADQSNPSQWQLGQRLVAIYFENGELKPEDKWRTIFFTDKNS